MKKYLAIVVTLFSSLLIYSSAHADENPTLSKDDTLTEVILLPTIHRNHERSKTYSIEFLSSIMQKIKPDIVCSEITPESLQAYDAKKPASRLNFFPEYTKSILPLRKELGYTVIPCSAYSKEVNFKTVGVKTMSKAHSKNIAKALDKIQGQGKKVLVTFGGGHISNILKNLTSRKDIKIIDYRKTLTRLQKDQFKAKP